MKKIENLLNKDQIQNILQDYGLEHRALDIYCDLEADLIQQINDRIRKEKNQLRLAKLESNMERIPAKDNLTEREIETLPAWIKNSLQHADIVGKSKRVIQTVDGKKYHLNNRLNSLSGGEWTFFLNSVINTRYPTTGKESYAHHIRKIHPSPKPPQLTKQIIEFFTKEGETVFDYFMGVGGTLLGASLCGRRALGIELNPEYVSAYMEACECLGLEKQSTIIGDALFLLKDQNQLSHALGDQEVSLILIDPPYGDMMARSKTGEASKKKINTSPTPFTDSEFDLGNMSSKKFHRAFRNCVKHSLKYLKNKGYLVVFIKDMQPKDKELNLLHSELIYSLNKISELNYLGLKIWADQGVNLYPYGYPYSYVSNQIHQFILVFRKNMV